jgi:hypothetical protein
MRIMSRIALPTFVTAVITSGIAVAITYATAWRDNVWAWLAVALLTVISAAISVWLYAQQQRPGTDESSATRDINTALSGTSDISIGRKAISRRVRARALRSKITVGDGTYIDEIDVVAGGPMPDDENRK